MAAMAALESALREAYAAIALQFGPSAAVQVKDQRGHRDPYIDLMSGLTRHQGLTAAWHPVDFCMPELQLNYSS